MSAEVNSTLGCTLYAVQYMQHASSYSGALILILKTVGIYCINIPRCWDIFLQAFFHINQRSKTVNSMRLSYTELSKKDGPAFSSSWSPLILNSREYLQKNLVWCLLYLLILMLNCYEVLTLKKTCLHKELSCDQTFIPSHPSLCYTSTG